MSYAPQLKDREYYENCYDRIVVTQCRILETALDSSLEKELSRIKEWRNETEIRNIDAYIRRMAMYFEKGELATKRDKTIQEWMESDREMDEFYEHTHPKRYPLCIKCDGEMKIREKISFFSYTKNEKHRMLFTFECKKCSLRRAFYDDWEEFYHKKQKCEKCKGTDMQLEILHEKNMTIYRDTCNSCGHVKEDSFESTKEEKDDNYVVDREKYVLSEKERDKYLDEKRNLDQLSQLVKDWKNKQGSILQKSKNLMSQIWKN